MEKDINYYACFYKNFIWEIITSNSFPIFTIYLIGVKFAFQWKKLSNPLELHKLMFVYNIFLSLVNIYCFYGFLKSLQRSDSIYDKKVDPDLSKVYFIYWITKVFELLDTVFMILRHKFRQITTLHVFHHASMVLLSDMGYNRYAWPAFSMPLLLNALVHVFLYLYYGLTAIGIQPSWKRLLTELQILQFLIDLVFAGYGLAYHNFCVWSLLYGFSMLYFFVKFYISAYLTKKQNEKYKST
nr:elongation of very long chain fatty acids protein 5 [Apocyclops royi]